MNELEQEVKDLTERVIILENQISELASFFSESITNVINMVSNLIGDNDEEQ